MTYGVIDIGSNTIRLCIYDVRDGSITSLFNSKNTAGLVDYVNDGELSRRGIRKACNVLNSYREMAKRAGIQELYVFATASLRNISNTADAVHEIRSQTGLAVDVLSGYDEAVLDFEGASYARNLQNGLLVDIGGGSTELLAFADGKIQEAVSLEIGSLFLYKNYVGKLFPKTKERKAICSRVDVELKKVMFLKERQYPDMIGIGGTIRAVKKFNNDLLGLEPGNEIIQAEHLKMMHNVLQDEERRTLKKILRIAPDRVHTLIPGMLILERICRVCGCQQIQVSGFGVREGYLYRKAVVEK